MSQDNLVDFPLVVTFIALYLNSQPDASGLGLQKGHIRMVWFIQIWKRLCMCFLEGICFAARNEDEVWIRGPSVDLSKSSFCGAWILNVFSPTDSMGFLFFLVKITRVKRINC